MSQGHGHATVLAQIAADELQVPMEDVEVVQGDTRQVQAGHGTFNSRSIPVGGSSVKACAGRIVAKANGPAGAWWLKNRMIGKVPMLTSQEIVSAAEHHGRLLVSVRFGGETAQFSTDHLIAGTGYKVDVSRLPFIDAALRAGIKTFNTAPVLSSAFESSVPGLYFVGIASALSFGPVMRFVYGAKYAAAILTDHLRTVARPASPPVAIAAVPAAAPRPSTRRPN